MDQPPRPLSPETLYDVLWRDRSAELEAMIAAGERNLARAVVRFAAWESGHLHEPEAMRQGGQVLLTGRVRRQPSRPAGWGRLSDGGPAYVPMRLRDGTVPVPRHLDAMAVPGRWLADLCDPETDAVVELGSGWGGHLFRTWLSGGPRNAAYVACDHSDVACRMAARLAALEPGLTFAAQGFDFRAPDFGFLKPYRMPLVYTCSSVVLIDHLPEDFFERLAAAAPGARVVFFEPVGYQVARGRRIGFEPAPGLDAREPPPRPVNPAFNRDLVERIDAAVAAGLAQWEMLAADAFSYFEEASSTMSVLRVRLTGSR